MSVHDYLASQWRTVNTTVRAYTSALNWCVFVWHSTLTICCWCGADLLWHYFSILSKHIINPNIVFLISLVIKEMGLENDLTTIKANKKWENMGKSRVNLFLNLFFYFYLVLSDKWATGSHVFYFCLSVYFTLMVNLHELSGSSPINTQ